MKNNTISKTVEQYGLFELPVTLATGRNDWRKPRIRAEFESPAERKEVRGFYDGNGCWKIRFMPSFVQDYTYRIFVDEKLAFEGSFEAVKPSLFNHGPVGVSNTYHFAYADGTPYYPLGTTCYVFALQDDELIESTFRQLSRSGFNKIRFCLFPKHYDYNLHEPSSYPFVGESMDSSVLTPENFMEYGPDHPDNHFDFDRINPEHFQKFDEIIQRLQDMGIQADLILFHPYDRWGFSKMSERQDLDYLQYMIDRYGAYRNVWWAMANEYDLLDKPLDHWEKLGMFLAENDPYRHLRSIHNCRPFYDHTKPWITHASLQRQDIYRTTEFTDELRIRFGKPIVWDEIGYEGNLQHGWGNLSGKELIRRCWEALCRGGYGSHSETLLNPSERLWWSHGGSLHGKSWKRFDFLKSILDQVPGTGLSPNPQMSWDEVSAVAESEFMLSVKTFYLFYYGLERPSFRTFYIDETTPFRVSLIDTWKMRIEDLGIHKGKFKVEMPSRPYMAIMLQKESCPLVKI